MADELKKGSAEQPKSKEKPAKPEKAKKDAKGAKDAKDGAKKKGNVFKRMGKAIAKFFKEERSETKKIVWPDAKTVLKSTAVVLVVVAVLAVVLWLVDTGLIEGIRALVNLAENVGSEAAAEGETTTAAAVAGRMFAGFIGF